MIESFVPTAYAQGEPSTATFGNPLAGVSGIPDLLFAIVNVLLIVAVPIIVFFVIFAGFSYVTAQGNPEKIKAASRSLLYALIGSVVVLGSFAIMSIIQDIVGQF